MKLVVLTVGDSIDCYILDQLERKFDVVGVLQFYDPPVASDKRTFNPLRLVMRWLRGLNDAWYARLDSWITRVGWQRLSPPPLRDAIRVPAKEVNGPETVSRIIDWGADYLILLGAPILKPPLFEAPKIGTINMHYESRRSTGVAIRSSGRC